MTEELKFDPMPLFKGSFRQTIFATIPSILHRPISHTKFVLLPDKDHLALEVTVPNTWKKNDLTVLMIHGLCGSHNSPILVRLAKKLQDINVRSIRLNLRGCGSGKGKAKKIYHAGQSEDVYEAIKAIHNDTPDSKIILMGFSLGGNIVLKLAAELSVGNINLLKKVIAINPPVDLHASINLLASAENQVYERYFINLLKKDIKFRYKKFPDIEKIEYPKKFHFYDFNNLYIVPQYGYKDLNDYYKRCSSKFLIPAINIDTNILFSEDDPIIKIQDFENFCMPSSVHLFKTKNGGHLGYFSKPGKSKSFYWIDDLILKWILDK
jgi:hypothetical protein